MTCLFDELTVHQNNKDKKVFGLVVQGGGMRATYSAGALVTLIEYGFSGVFDHVIGSSAGGMNAAYFVSSDAETAHVYTDDLPNKNFINLLRRDKKVDIDYLVDLVLKHKRPINIENLLKSHSKLHIVVTNAQTGRKEVISNHHKFVEIYEEFRATAALPLLYDKKVAIGDKWYIDGGVADLLPIDIAIKLGCTDIVVIMTQVISSYRFDKQHTRLVKHLISRLAKNQSAAVRKVLPTNERLLKINLRRLTHPIKKTRFYILEPSNEEMLFSLLTIDKLKVAELAALGVKDMDAFLQKPITN